MTVTGGNPADALLGIHGFTDAVEIGRGSFGAVYRAHQPAVGRDVAIKILTVGSGGSTERFDRERNVLGALSGHPAIVTVFDSGYTEAGQPYVVMELMSGGSLGERIATSGPLPWQEAVDTGIRIAGGLEVAHRMGVLHRDVKPDNLLVSNYGDVKLADFGVATFVGGASSRAWSVIASVAYAAPEVLGGQRSTVSSDVYGLAATVFAFLCGHAPFARATDDSVLPMVTRILTDRPPDVRTLGVPNAVCLVLERAMEKDAGARYPSAQAFGAALQDAQRALGVRVTTMVIDPNLSALPPHDVVTAAQRASLETTSAGDSSDTPPPPPPPVVMAPPPPTIVPPVVPAPPIEQSPWAPVAESGTAGVREPDSTPSSGSGSTAAAAAAGAAAAFALGADKAERSPWAPRSDEGTAAPEAPSRPEPTAAVPDPFAPTSTAVAGAAVSSVPSPPPPVVAPPPPPPPVVAPPPPPPPPPTAASPKPDATATTPIAATAAGAAAGAAAAGATQTFDAGPVLADMVTGKSRTDNGHGSRRRTAAVVAAAAVLVIGSGVASYAIVSHDNNNDSKHAATPTTFLPTTGPTVATTAASTSSVPPTTAVPATQAPATTATTAATAPPATQATTPPPPPPTPAPTVSLSGPTSIEDNVGVVYHASTTNATSGNWALTGGPAVNLHSTAWHPGVGFGFTAGCNAVGATYTLTLHATGPGGSGSGSISFTVHDTNRSCH